MFLVHIVCGHSCMSAGCVIGMLTVSVMQANVRQVRYQEHVDLLSEASGFVAV